MKTALVPPLVYIHVKLLREYQAQSQDRGTPEADVLSVIEYKREWNKWMSLQLLYAHMHNQLPASPSHL